jgi:hypothetical protein
MMVSHSSRKANLSWSLPYDGKSPILAFHLEFHRPDAGKYKLFAPIPPAGRPWVKKTTMRFFYRLQEWTGSD